MPQWAVIAAVPPSPVADKTMPVVDLSGQVVEGVVGTDSTRPILPAICFIRVSPLVILDRKGRHHSSHDTLGIDDPGDCHGEEQA